MLKIKKGDTVQVVKGKDKGKKGKIIEITAFGKRALVQGINLVKKHKRRTQTDQQGGIVSIETPISLFNLMVSCKHCARPVRVGIKILNDGSRVRFCRACKETL